MDNAEQLRRVFKTCYLSINIPYTTCTMSECYITHNLGFPRIGPNRELKLTTEKFWQGKITEDDLVLLGKQIRKQNWLLQKERGIQLIPSNDFTFYDQILDTVGLYGVIPERFGWDGKQMTLNIYFTMARGIQEKENQEGETKKFALEMLKWFDTNYHYMVPEFNENMSFTLASSKVFDEFKEALLLGITSKPVLISPVTFLHLGKSKGNFNRFTLLAKLLPLFVEVVQRLIDLGAQWIQVDEPILVLELSDFEKEAIKLTYETLRNAIKDKAKILLATYFEGLGDNTSLTAELAVDVIHVDLTRGDTDLKFLSRIIKENGKSLSLGCIDGRNIWKSHFSRVLEKIKSATEELPPEHLLIAPSCSLIHSPISVANETDLPEDVKQVISFSVEKLTEVSSIKALLQNPTDPNNILALQANSTAWQNFFHLPQLNNSQVRNRVLNKKAEYTQRKSPYSVRKEQQRKLHNIPLFPTTTIGSLPQTMDTRQQRLKYKKGEISESQYNEFIKEKIKEGIELQDNLGIDILVHGEFERNDMVEYFAEMLEGFIFTKNGWVQSFGSRYVKPPIIYGDVNRPQSMTVNWISYAASLTKKPIKGMLTGPITILQWSFVREDQPRSQTAFQIAFAIRDEVSDLEKAGIDFIQVDEPAFREGLPLKRSLWNEYLKWASEAFRLAICCVEDKTQIHTHMCYCEFADIIQSIALLDADVISIESSRSQMKLLGTFAEYRYPNEIGPGVFDIHSPRVPSVEELLFYIKEAKKVIPFSQLWVNPDCGLKTRQYTEVKKSLSNMVEAVKIARREHNQ